MNFTKPKLLLADDSATIRKVVEMTFADEGIDVSSVADGPSAMKAFVESQPDIVLVDASLAGTNGYDICRTIKHDESTRHIPVLLLVGSFEPFDHEAAEQAGADGFITKPFHSIRDLVARVSELLGRERSNPADPAPETADIDNLYHKSFDGTLKLEDLETVDEMLLDLGRNGEPEQHEGAAADIPLIDELDSPDADLGDTGMDDELIEAATPLGLDNGNGSSSPENAADAIKAFDWSPGAIIRAKPDTPRLVRVRDDESPALDEQMIERIAARVVEKLSDQVIREIAQEVVPRVAERLIRDALTNQDKR